MVRRLIFVWILFICFVCGCTNIEGLPLEQPQKSDTTPIQTIVPTPDLQGNTISLMLDVDTKLLFTYLEPFFEDETGYQIELVDMYVEDNDETTQNHYIENTTQTDCKVIYSIGEHYSDKEIFFQCYALLGPPRDPALVRNAGDLTEAFSRIKSSEISFISEELFYTWEIEQMIWDELGYIPDPEKDPWYNIVYFDSVESKDIYFDENASYIFDNIFTCARTENLTLLYTDTLNCRISFYVESTANANKADLLTTWLRSEEGRKRIEWYNLTFHDGFTAPYFTENSVLGLVDYYIQYDPANGKNMYEMIQNNYRGTGWVEGTDAYCAAQVLPDTEWKSGSSLPAIMCEVPLNYPLGDFYTNIIGSKKLYELAPDLDNYFRLAQQAAQDTFVNGQASKNLYVFADQNKPVYFTDPSMIYFDSSGHIRVRGASIFKSIFSERYYISIREFAINDTIGQTSTLQYEGYEIAPMEIVRHLEIDKKIVDEFIGWYNRANSGWIPSIPKDDTEDTLPDSITN